MTAICPVGPPKLSAATRAQTRTASANEIPCEGRSSVPATRDVAVLIARRHASKRRQIQRPPAAVAAPQRIIRV
jgi:hypothetical protein